MPDFAPFLSTICVTVHSAKRPSDGAAFQPADLQSEQSA
jgi:hypothetical protein